MERAGNINVYDITKYHEYSDSLIESYLKNPVTQDLWKLNKDLTYGGQSGNVYEAMYEDFMKRYELFTDREKSAKFDFAGLLSKNNTPKK